VVGEWDDFLEVVVEPLDEEGLLSLDFAVDSKAEIERDDLGDGEQLTRGEIGLRFSMGSRRLLGKFWP
jgi:hypothetical protein